MPPKKTRKTDRATIQLFNDILPLKPFNVAAFTWEVRTKKGVVIARITESAKRFKVWPSNQPFDGGGVLDTTHLSMPSALGFIEDEIFHNRWNDLIQSEGFTPHPLFIKADKRFRGAKVERSGSSHRPTQRDFDRS